jgi:signal peptidase II
MGDRPAAPASRRRLVLFIAAVALGVVALDQLTKTLAVRGLADGPVHLFWTLRLNLSYNSGAAFSIGTGMAPVFTAVGVVLLLVLLRAGRAATTVIGALAIALLLGGATGNLIDRLVRENHGAVIDFVDFQWWPIFNVADMAIVGGAILLAVASWTQERAPTPT